MTSIIITTGLALLALVGFVGEVFAPWNDIPRSLGARILLTAGLFGLALRLMGWL